jgi:hypothetical protein
MEPSSRCGRAARALRAPVGLGFIAGGGYDMQVREMRQRAFDELEAALREMTTRPAKGSRPGGRTQRERRP